jgi:hypothetical protein
MTALPFEVHGDVPEAWNDDLAQFAEGLEAHEWGGPSIDVLAVGDVSVALQRLLGPDEFKEWETAIAEGVLPVDAALSFNAADGRRVALAPPMEDRDLLFALIAHEMAESALARRHDAEGHEVVDGEATSVAHVLWSDYVVERTRRQLFSDLGLGWSALDRSDLTPQVAAFEQELPELVTWAVQNSDVPMRVLQYWFGLARDYAMCRGRGDEASLGDIEAIAQFRGLPLLQPSVPGWDALDGALRAAYAEPKLPTDTHDQRVLETGWSPLFDSLGNVWNPRYQAAGGAVQ